MGSETVAPQCPKVHGQLAPSQLASSSPAQGHKSGVSGTTFHGPVQKYPGSAASHLPTCRPFIAQSQVKQCWRESASSCGQSPLVSVQMQDTRLLLWLLEPWLLELLVGLAEPLWVLVAPAHWLFSLHTCKYLVFLRRSCRSDFRLPATAHPKETAGDGSGN